MLGDQIRSSHSHGKHFTNWTFPTLFSWLVCFGFLFVFETGSHVAETDAQPSMSARLTLNSCSPCFYFPSAGIVGVYHHGSLTSSIKTGILLSILVRRRHTGEIKGSCPRSYSKMLQAHNWANLAGFQPHALLRWYCFLLSESYLQLLVQGWAYEYLINGFIIAMWSKSNQLVT